MIQELMYIFDCNFNEIIIEQALTHSSYVNEKGGTHYQRLELLGDSVLSLCVVEMLYKLYPKASEGELTQMRAFLVQEKTLAEIAREYGIAEYIKFGIGSNKQGLKDNDSILADVIEALLAAAFLSADLDNARKFVSKIYKNKINFELRDFKTQLQEILAKKQKSPVYELLSMDGPDHKKVFCCQVIIDGKVYGKGEANKKKEAEQLAASSAIRNLDSE